MTLEVRIYCNKCGGPIARGATVDEARRRASEAGAWSAFDCHHCAPCHNMLRTAGYGGSAKPAVKRDEAASNGDIDGRVGRVLDGLNGGSAPP